MCPCQYLSVHVNPQLSPVALHLITAVSPVRFTHIDGGTTGSAQPITGTYTGNYWSVCEIYTCSLNSLTHSTYFVNKSFNQSYTKSRSTHARVHPPPSHTRTERERERERECFPTVLMVFSIGIRHPQNTVRQAPVIWTI